jgi:hypothetical protein
MKSFQAGEKFMRIRAEDKKARSAMSKYADGKTKQQRSLVVRSHKSLSTNVRGSAKRIAGKVSYRSSQRANLLQLSMQIAIELESHEIISGAQAVITAITIMNSSFDSRIRKALKSHSSTLSGGWADGKMQ